MVRYDYSTTVNTIQNLRQHLLHITHTVSECIFMDFNLIKCDKGNNDIQVTFTFIKQCQFEQEKDKGPLVEMIIVQLASHLAEPQPRSSHPLQVRELNTSASSQPIPSLSLWIAHISTSSVHWTTTVGQATRNCQHSVLMFANCMDVSLVLETNTKAYLYTHSQPARVASTVTRI